MSRYREATTALTVVVVAGVIAAAYFMGRSDERAGRDLGLVGTAIAKGHQGLARKTYYPNTEELGPNEMRVISLGTGMPNQRKSQASAC